MAEKRGNLVKMVYDFDTASHLEIYSTSLKDWFRVTSREFRSYNTKRRINGQPYEGRVYIYGTNKIANKSETPIGKMAGYKYKPSTREYGD